MALWRGSTVGKFMMATKMSHGNGLARLAEIKCDGFVTVTKLECFP
jgi:hypothetical protein